MFVIRGWSISSVDKVSVLLDELSDLGLYFLPFRLHLLDALLHCINRLFYFMDNYGNYLVVLTFTIIVLTKEQYL